MATTFIINPGSSSRKYALFADEVMIYHAQYSLDSEGAIVQHRTHAGASEEATLALKDFSEVLSHVVTDMRACGAIADPTEVTHIAVRVVAPGTLFAQHTEITNDYLAQLEHQARYAPLHIPHTLEEVTQARALFSQAKSYAISDSAIHQSIPPHRHTLSVQKKDATQHGITGYGYHGISLASVLRTLHAQGLGSVEKTIVVHLGGGISVHAVDADCSMATSMGFDPSGGITMSSRGGDLSAGDMLAIMSTHNMDVPDAYQYLYRESGFYGMLGVSDMRAVLEKYEQGHDDARLLIDKLRYELQSHLAAYALHLQGITRLVLTGTALARNAALRKILFGDLAWWGIAIDTEHNHQVYDEAARISTPESTVEVWVIPASEEREMHALTKEFF